MISIISENAFFIVLSKPNGVSVHNEKPSLLDWLISQNKSTHFVNRLDLETSGLVLVAQKPEYQEPLSQAIHYGEKTYRALLRTGWSLTHKEIPTPLTETWSLSLSDKAEGRKNPQGKKEEQKPCLTLVDVIRFNQYFTEVFCTIKTGRQHQIRKHAALARHPILGDKRYNDENYNKKMASIYKQDRMFLHAEKLNFEFNGEKYSFTDASSSHDMNCDAFFSTVI